MNTIFENVANRLSQAEQILSCQSIIRPAVILFGEALPERGIQALHQF